MIRTAVSILVLLAFPLAAHAGACADAVQGKIAWNYQGAKRWNPDNISRLCRSAEGSRQPARCFERVMHEGVNWGGGTRWKWSNAVSLCRGTRDAKGTIDCFEKRIASGMGWREAIDACQWNIASARRVDDSEGGGSQAQSGLLHVDIGGSYLKAASGLCLTLNVFDQPRSRGEKVKSAFKKAFDPREHAKAMAGAAGAGLVFGPGGPELASTITSLRSANKVREAWKGELVHGTGVTLMECGATNQKFQRFERDGRFIRVVAEPNRCIKAKQGQTTENGGRVQMGKCKRQQRTAWYRDGAALRNGKGKCLDVHKPQLRSEGARIQLWSCNKSTQQRWRLVSP